MLLEQATFLQQGLSSFRPRQLTELIAGFQSTMFETNSVGSVGVKWVPLGENKDNCFSIKFITRGISFQSINLEPSWQWIVHKTGFQGCTYLRNGSTHFTPADHSQQRAQIINSNANLIKLRFLCCSWITQSWWHYQWSTNKPNRLWENKYLHEYSDVFGIAVKESPRDDWEMIWDCTNPELLAVQCASSIWDIFNGDSFKSISMYPIPRESTPYNKWAVGLYPLMLPRAAGRAEIQKGDLMTLTVKRS